MAWWHRPELGALRAALGSTRGRRLDDDAHFVLALEGAVAGGRSGAGHFRAVGAENRVGVGGGAGPWGSAAREDGGHGEGAWRPRGAGGGELLTHLGLSLAAALGGSADEESNEEEEGETREGAEGDANYVDC